MSASFGTTTSMRPGRKRCGLPERQVGHAMQPDRRLPAARAPLDGTPGCASFAMRSNCFSSSSAAIAGRCLSCRSSPSRRDAAAAPAPRAVAGGPPLLGLEACVASPRASIARPCPDERPLRRRHAHELPARRCSRPGARAPSPRPCGRPAPPRSRRPRRTGSRAGSRARAASRRSGSPARSRRTSGTPMSTSRGACARPPEPHDRSAARSPPAHVAEVGLARSTEPLMLRPRCLAGAPRCASARRAPAGPPAWPRPPRRAARGGGPSSSARPCRRGRPRHARRARASRRPAASAPRRTMRVPPRRPRGRGLRFSGRGLGCEGVTSKRAF